ncbi:homologous recombination OB-fold protein [Arvicola amphibius]|uniref:homologous recombination OB-fold protein n=1 Tax=Arvicola amphibius TaxID=1047088 RepID=UPI0018E2CA58|nr:homologous recombination OB-fold protein [Arvicola amphibius]
MTCSFQKLFAVEEEFEDEDFLSAVENAENHLAGVPSGNAGHLMPVSSRPQQEETPQAPSRLLPSYPTSSRQPVPGLRLPTSSLPQTTRDSDCPGAVSLRPISISSGVGNQQRTTLTKVLQESAEPRPLPSATHSGFIFGSHQQGIGGFEAPNQDEFDKTLQGADLELELGVDTGATQTLPAQHHEDPVLVKKARVADLSGSFQKSPIVPCRNPGLSLRPRAAGGLPLTSASAVPHQRGSPVPAPQPPQVGGRPIQNSPQNHLPGQPFQSPRAWSSGTPRFPGPLRPHCSSAAFPRGPLPSRAPVSLVKSPASTPRGASTPVPQPALQTPLVTNHLVQLVTATNRTPQQPSRPSIRAKTRRRFPGPAGLLPHQLSGKNLEEIMVATPQTPTHGAVAKLQTEIVTSSQGSVEEDFGRGPWLTMKSALGLDERDPSCFLYTYSIVMVLRKAALKQLPRNKVPNMAVMIKSLTRSTMDASVVFKDPTGEMLGTVHRVLLETHQNELKPGSVLLLKQIGVFSPSLRNHYLNVTPNNLVHIYGLDSGDSDCLEPPQPLPKNLGNFHGNLQPDVAAEPTQGLSTAQNPAVSPEEELPEADDLDGLLSELPEDFFSDPSWGCLKTGHPP